MKQTATIQLVLVALFPGALWYYGRHQPITVVERELQSSVVTACDSCKGSKTVGCSGCGGTGSVSAGTATCPSCHGSGRGDWQMRSTLGVRRMSGDRGPVCPTCRGVARWEKTGICTQCSGTTISRCTRCAGEGTISTSRKQVQRTVRADISLWERVLSWFFIKPDPDCAPQVSSGGRVPLVEAYLKLFQRNDSSGVVVDWSGVSRVKDTWQIRTKLSIRRGSVKSEESRVFLVKNREVTGVTAVP